jgi:hypothetical protein
MSGQREMFGAVPDSSSRLHPPVFPCHNGHIVIIVIQAPLSSLCCRPSSAIDETFPFLIDFALLAYHHPLMEIGRSQVQRKRRHYTQCMMVPDHTRNGTKIRKGWNSLSGRIRYDSIRPESENVKRSVPVFQINFVEISLKMLIG